MVWQIDTDMSINDSVIKFPIIMQSQGRPTATDHRVKSKL